MDLYSILINSKMRKILFLFLILIFFKIDIIANELTEINKNIKDAELYYWIGMEENGDMRSYQKGLALLDTAGMNLKDLNLPEKDRKNILSKINSLKTEIEQQADISHDTLIGVFPMIRLLTPSLFWDSLADKTYELNDDPSVIALTSAMGKLIEDVLIKWKKDIQLNVIINSFPKNKALENELLYVLNINKKFFVHNEHELVNALSEEEYEVYTSTGSNKTIIKKLAGAFKTGMLLEIKINELNVIDNNYFYRINGIVHNVEKNKPETTFSTNAFCRDRRDQLIPILLTNIFLFLLAVILFIIINKTINKKGEERQSWTNYILVPAIGFLVGRFSPWVLVTLASGFTPPLETLAILSFWWPMILVSVLYIGPLFIYQNAISRFGRNLKIFKIENKGGSIFLSISLGVSAYMSGAYFLYLENEALFFLIPLIISSSLISVSVSRVMDNILIKTYNLGFILLLSLLVGLIYTSLLIIPVWVFVLITLIFLLYLISLTTNGENPEHKKEKPESETETPKDISTLINSTKKPIYQTNENFDKAKKIIDESKDSLTVLCLSGKKGIGKTATANALIEDLKNEAENRGQTIKVYSGECPHNEKENLDPYAPFENAINKHSSKINFTNMESHSKLINSPIDEIISSIPAVSLFYSAKDNPNINSQQDIFDSVKRMFDENLNMNKVILFIDNIQWIDDNSKKLLKFLIKKYKNEKQFVILLALRNKDNETTTDCAFSDRILEMESMNDNKERVNLLIKSLAISKDTAKIIVKRTRNNEDLEWLFKAVRSFAESDYFQKKGDSFELKDQYIKYLPNPDQERYKDSIKEKITKYSQYKHFLSCAACIGESFDTDILSDCLNIPRLEILRELSEVEDKTGIIRDDKKNDNIFIFDSAYDLEIIRKIFGITFEGPKNEVPQLVREFHSKIALHLEKKLERSPNEISKVAKHYYASGESHTEKAVKYCLRAVNFYSENFVFETARVFLEMVKEYNINIKERRIVIDLNEAHITGEESIKKKAIENSKKLLDEKDPIIKIKTKLLVLRALYESGDYKEAIIFAEGLIKIINKKPNNNEVENIKNKAEVLHFLGICMVERKKGELINDLVWKEKLNDSIKLLDSIPDKDQDIYKLYSRVLDSIAQKNIKLIDDKKKRGLPFDKNLYEESEKLFKDRLEIAEKNNLNDRLGKAMTCGGLGRLYMKWEPERTEEAKKYFEINLEISKEIGNITGLIMMPSEIGQCQLNLKQYEDSNSSYSKSLELAEKIDNKISVFYAYRGLILSSCYLKIKKDIDSYSKKLSDFLKEQKKYFGDKKGIFEILDKLLKEKIVEKYNSEDWYIELEELTKQNI